MNGLSEQRHEVRSSITTVLSTLSMPKITGQVIASVDECRRLFRHAQLQLTIMFGCIANAIAWLHGHRVRHRDMKPAQILLSCDGLWLTDFGTSSDMSDITISATDNGHPITPKYHAPERANMEPCDWPEDVFTLGCIYLEMAYHLLTPGSDRNSGPWVG